MPRIGLSRKSIRGGSVNGGSSIKESNDEKLRKMYEETLRIVDDKQLEAKGLQPNKIKDMESDKIRKKFHI
jgi:hypothetical protein